MVFVVKHKSAYYMRISDWSSAVCSPDLAVNPHRIVGGQRQLARQFAGNDGALRSGVDDEVERPLAINVYWQGDPPRHVPAGGDYGGSAIVALRVVGDRLWRRSGGPSQSHSLKHPQHCHCAEGASQERTSHATRLRPSPPNLAFAQDSTNLTTTMTSPH